MFVRRKPNKSGSVSIQVISKAGGKYKVVKTVGSSSNPEEIERLWIKAHGLLPDLTGQLVFNLNSKRDQTIDNFLKDVKNLDVQVVGPELIYGTLFDRIGFNDIPDEFFRYLVLARLAYPGSKLKTIDYLYRYCGKVFNVHSLYYSLDRLHNKYKKQVERIAFNHTKKLLGNQISVIFYDMTTIHFETESEDDLRKIGFSKNGKFQKPQIMLGLLVGENGYPISYDVFKGNTYEGHTLLPALKSIQRKYKLGKPVVIADAALLSKDNLKQLASNGYTYIIAARIKNEAKIIKAEIIKSAKTMKDGSTISIDKTMRGKTGRIRLIVSYTDKRAKKDAYNRKRGLRKLKKRIKSGMLTKQHINNRGYNKFLTLKGKVRIELNKNKIKEDKKWDGLKGYITNTDLQAKEIIKNYRHLWQIEKAFRISKTDLRIQPIHLRLAHRIKAHVCICFTAYSIYKELERLLYRHKANLSVEKAAELTHTMYQLSYVLPESRKTKKIIFEMDAKQKAVCSAVNKC